MGDDAYERTATAGGDRRRCSDVLREAMDAGAAGFATSFAFPHRGIDGKPVPSRFADRAEFEALLDDDGRGRSRRGVDRARRPVPAGRHVRPAAEGRRAVHLGRAADVARPQPPAGARREPRRVGAGRRGVAAGHAPTAHVPFTLDSPYPLAVNEHFAALQNASIEERTRAYADPAWREQMMAGLGGAGSFGLRWDTYTIGQSDVHPELVDRRLADVAAERGVEPLDCLLDLALDEPGLALRVRTIIANDDEAGVADLLVDEHCTLGLSDAGAHAGQLCDAPQATDLLGNWVRDKGVMPMEQAIRKLSGLQADLFGFADRGYLRPGAWADVAVFDPATVAPGPDPAGARLPGRTPSGSPPTSPSACSTWS